jgi:hypothetical protein
MKALHEKYGSIPIPGSSRNRAESVIGHVVRWAPDELSFSSAQAYDDIYKPQKPGVIFLKDPNFYVTDDT